MRDRRDRLTTLLGTAFAGLVAGHVLDYLIVDPNPAVRHAALAHTGHAYIPRALAIGAALASTATLLAARRAVRRAAGAGDARPVEIRGTALALALLQVGAFLILEVAERLAAGAGLRDLWGPLLWLGVPLQILVAGIGALILALIDRGVERMALALWRRPIVRSRPSNATRPEVPLLNGALHPRRRPSRAPPFLPAPTR